MHLGATVRSVRSFWLLGASVLAAGAFLLFLLFIGREEGAGAVRPVQGLGETAGPHIFQAAHPPSMPGDQPTAAESSPGREQAEMSTAERYLRQLEDLARSNKPAALALAQKPTLQFPEQGVFAEAREAMSITLLVDLGRMSEARDEVRRFIHTHPQSRYRPLVQGVTGIHPQPTRSKIP